MHEVSATCAYSSFWLETTRYAEVVAVKLTRFQMAVLFVTVLASSVAVALATAHQVLMDRRLDRVERVVFP